MITVLQRQHVSKRPASPVPSRARPTGVRWGAGEPGARPSSPPAPRPQGTLSVLRVQSPKRVRAEPPGSRLGDLLKGQRIPRTRGTGERRRASFLRELRLRREQRARRARLRRAERRDSPGERRAFRGRPGEAPRHAAAERQAAEGPRSPLLAALRARPALLAGAAAFVVVLAVAVALVPRLLPGTAARPELPGTEDSEAAIYDLLIPDLPEPASAGTSPVLLEALKLSSYRTVAGDSISKIAARFDLAVDTVVSWNDIRDARSLAAGTTLSIPSRDGVKYRVRRGDTLQGIAKAWNVDLNSVLDVNALASSVITVGQVLFIPGARMNPADLSRALGSLFTWPVRGRISSYFGQRADPWSGLPSLHTGVDIVSATGTAVGAAMTGTVRRVGFNPTFGNFVILQHSGGWQTLYGHLARWTVKLGQKVAQGEKIGELGATGHVTGAHLHLSFFRSGQLVDPLKYLK